MPAFGRPEVDGVATFPASCSLVGRLGFERNGPAIVKAPGARFGINIRVSMQRTLS